MNNAKFKKLDIKKTRVHNNFHAGMEGVVREPNLT